MKGEYFSAGPSDVQTEKAGIVVSSQGDLGLLALFPFNWEQSREAENGLMFFSADTEMLFVFDISLIGTAGN